MLKSFCEYASRKEIFDLLKVLPLEEQIFFSEKISEKFQKEKDLSKLLYLWLKMPKNFSLLCQLTCQILALILEKEGKESFQHWFSRIVPIWGLMR